MEKYRKRIADDILQDKLHSKGAVLIEGAKWCGKTTTALQAARSVLNIENHLNWKIIFDCQKLIQVFYLLAIVLD